MSNDNRIPINNSFPLPSEAVEDEMTDHTLYVPKNSNYRRRVTAMQWAVRIIVTAIAVFACLKGMGVI